MTVHRSEHSIVVSAAPRSVYALVADVTRWPAIFEPTVYARHLERTGSRERFQLWAQVNGAVSSWTSRRVLDEDQLHVSFYQEVSQPPVASMAGEWSFRPRPHGQTEVLLSHAFSAVDDDPRQVDWIKAAVDRNSRAELAALARVAGLGVPVDEVVFSFEDVVQVPGTAADAYEFIRRGDLWPERLPHVRQAELTEFPGGVQLLAMTTVTADGSTHDTRSYRIGRPGEWMAYKQQVTPALLTGHSGLWSFAPGPLGSGVTIVTAQHTVALDPAAVTALPGQDRTLSAARDYVRDALGRNSKATLAHIAAHHRSAVLPVDSFASFRAAMSRFPAGVVIVTTRGAEGAPYGFTASSFCSVSLEPPLVLVCLAASASCHPVFAETQEFAVSILRDGQEHLARRFATKSADKFAEGGFAATPQGLSAVDEALAVIECSVHARYEAGDHLLIVGLVESVGLADPGMPVVYFDRGYSTLK